MTTLDIPLSKHPYRDLHLVRDGYPAYSVNEHPQSAGTTCARKKSATRW
jgi:hypothetical protein